MTMHGPSTTLVPTPRPAPERHAPESYALERPAPERSAPEQDVLFSEGLLDRLLGTTTAVHAAGLKSFGLLLADPSHPHFPYVATDVAFFDPRKNRRNDPGIRPAFEAQGTYFRSYDDAGFVADAAELLQIYRGLEDSGLEAVALFHVHRRQPANFSVIDFRLHNPAYAWHLIISLRDPGRPVLAPFAVRKDAMSEFGISPGEDNEGSEQSYTGPEVFPLRLVVEGRDVPAGRAEPLARARV
jgi:proteasome lid subunit RPN8/RPN11